MKIRQCLIIKDILLCQTRFIKIEPEMLCDELNFFKAGIITEVTPLSYNVRDDRWTFKVFGYGVYNEKMTTKEIVRKYYFDTEEP